MKKYCFIKRGYTPLLERGVRGDFFSRLTFSTLLFVLLPLLSHAVPQTINYQGVYRESGIPVTGDRLMTFRITDSGGSVEYWTSGPVTVSVSTGVFRVGLAVPDSLNWGSITPYLEVKVGTTTLSPRDPITSTVYAFFASTAQTLSASAVIAPSNTAGTAMTLTQAETVTGAKIFNADLLMGTGRIKAAPGQSAVVFRSSVSISPVTPGELTYK